SRPRYVPGDLIAGKYLLGKLIGEGGMGSVWLAQNMDLDAPVAIKLLSGDVAPIEAAARLRREARAAARVEHRAIVRVFDCGETEHGDPFIVMELLEGRTLADVLDGKQALSVISAIQLMLPIIDGLSTAHDHGIVHRDIKPENIFLAQGARNVQPKVVDFGIAKIDRWDPNPGITLQGTVIGSPSYMAPEQARGLDDVDHRSDIWAVCAVLYEAVAGQPPFRGETHNAVLRSIIEEEVTPLTSMGGDEAALWTVLERGFAKDRFQRHQTMRELGTALAAVLLGRGMLEDICGDPIASTWGIRALPAHDAPLHGLGGSETSPASRSIRLPADPPSPAWRPAPTSTSGVETPSGVVRRRPRSVLFPSLAALALVGLTATALSRWNAPAPPTAAVRAPLAPEATNPEPAPPTPEVTPIAATRLAASVTGAPPSLRPMEIAVKKPLTLEQQPARPKRAKTHHGWPQASDTASVLAALPQVPASNDLALSRARSDRVTGSLLGLKDPYP
ncbi:MAG TPA: protein kinase, partial [Polyangiaceae bacterium]